MGNTVKSVVAPISNAVNTVVDGVKDIAQGNVAKGLGQVGEGYVDLVKSGYGVSSDNKIIGYETAKTALGEFQSNPSGFVAGAAEAYATGGASLVPQAGASFLQGLQGSGGAPSSPSQLANRGGAAAPQLPSNSSPIYSAAEGKDLTMPVLIGGGIIVAAIILKKKGR